MCTNYWLTAYLKLAHQKSMVRLTDCINMTIAVDWDVKHIQRSGLTKCQSRSGSKPFNTLIVFLKFLKKLILKKKMADNNKMHEKFLSMQRVDCTALWCSICKPACH